MNGLGDARQFMVVGDPRKLAYFARAEAVRSGITHMPGALMGFGVAADTNPTSCPPGYRLVTASTGKRVCITEQRAGGGGGTNMVDTVKSFFTGFPDSEKKYTVSFTPEARALIDTPGSFGPPAIERAAEDDTILGMPKWVAIGVGALVGVGLLAVIVKR